MDWGSSPLICSAIGSLLIGLTGILPLIFIDKNYEDSKWMKYVLAFGAGTLLGDAFLHLLPEAMNYPNWGYGVLFGYMFGFVVEKCLPEELAPNAGAYVNLMANCLDNFTHGLAIGGAFVINRTAGIKTTVSILLHEIPHEIGDFAILLRGGLKRSHAAVLQLITALAGLLGAMFVIFLQDVNSDLVKIFIVPFTIGAFVFVALTNVLPELTSNQRDFHWVISYLVLGVAMMGFISHD